MIWCCMAHSEVGHCRWNCQFDHWTNVSVYFWCAWCYQPSFISIFQYLCSVWKMTDSEQYHRAKLAIKWKCQNNIRTLTMGGDLGGLGDGPPQKHLRWVIRKFGQRKFCPSPKLDAKFPPLTLTLPAHSQDMNPIENLWRKVTLEIVNRIRQSSGWNTSRPKSI